MPGLVIEGSTVEVDITPGDTIGLAAGTNAVGTFGFTAGAAALTRVKIDTASSGDHHRIGREQVSGDGHVRHELLYVSHIGCWWPLYGHSKRWNANRCSGPGLQRLDRYCDAASPLHHCGCGSNSRGDRIDVVLVSDDSPRRRSHRGCLYRRSGPHLRKRR